MLDDGPQRLNRVELRGVARHPHDLDIVEVAVRAYVMSFVGGSPVEHELQRLVLVLRQECISEQAHEVEEVVTVRALVLLEDRVCEGCTDGSEHRDRLVA